MVSERQATAADCTPLGPGRGSTSCRGCGGGSCSAHGFHEPAEGTRWNPQVLPQHPCPATSPPRSPPSQHFHQPIKRVQALTAPALSPLDTGAAGCTSHLTPTASLSEEGKGGSVGVWRKRPPANLGTRDGAVASAGGRDITRQGHSFASST